MRLPRATVEPHVRDGGLDGTGPADCIGVLEPAFPRVLVSEDDPAIRRVLALTLRRRHVEVELTEHGADAIAAMQRQRFAVLVLDLMMPYVNGWEVIRWIAEHPEHRPRSVLVMSAADRESLKSLDPAVVNAIIFKPFDVSLVAAYVTSTLKLERPDRRRARIVKSPEL